jgi:hypothetical protein
MRSMIGMFLILTQSGFSGAQIQIERLGPFHSNEALPFPKASRNGLHVAYVVESPTSHKQQVVFDGKLEPEYDEVDYGSLVLSTHGQHVAYKVRRGGKEFVVVDDQEGPEYDTVGEIALSPDGKRVAYAAQDGLISFVVVDGKEGQGFPARPGYIGIGAVIFSPDSRIVAFDAAVANGRSRVFMNDKRGVEYDDVSGSTLTFSPDSKRLAYVAQKGGKHVVVVNGENEFRNVSGFVIIGEFVSDAPVFSPDSKHLAYVAENGSGDVVAVDGKNGRPYEQIPALLDSVIYSPDSKHLAYPAKRRGKWIMVLDEREIGLESENPASYTVAFSPDSQHLAYAVSRNGKWYMAVDGKLGPAYDHIFMNTTVFSPDSKHLAYVARRGAEVRRGAVGPLPRYFLVLDGEDGIQYEGIVTGNAANPTRTGRPTFSPDSKLLAYAARKDGKWRHDYRRRSGPRVRVFHNISISFGWNTGILGEQRRIALSDNTRSQRYIVGHSTACSKMT